MRWAASWSLYWIGDAAHRLNDDILPDRLWQQWLFDLYQKTMTLASDIQGDGPGPWLPR